MQEREGLKGQSAFLQFMFGDHVDVARFCSSCLEDFLVIFVVPKEGLMHGST